MTQSSQRWSAARGGEPGEEPFGVGPERRDEGAGRVADLVEARRGHLDHEVGGEREVTAVVEGLHRGEREERVELARQRHAREVELEAGEVIRVILIN